METGSPREVLFLDNYNVKTDSDRDNIVPHAWPNHEGSSYIPVNLTTTYRQTWFCSELEVETVDVWRRTTIP